jgi:hypothetical protein
MPLSRPPTVSHPPPFEAFVEALIGILAATLMTLLAAAAMVWREDAVGSASRVLMSMVWTGLLAAGQRP